MTKKKKIIIVTRKLPLEVETRMQELFDPQFNTTEQPLSREEMIKAVQTAEVLVPTVSDKIDAELISHAGPQLKMIASFGTGTDHIDVASAYKKGIIVTSTPGVSTDDTADMTMALILAVPRRIAEGTSLMQSGESWPGWSPTWMLGRRLKGKKLGIIGLGRIGQGVAERARAFGLSIHYHGRRPVAKEIEEQLGATYYANLDDMLAEMDIISINCPYTPETYHLLSQERLAHIKPEAYIVNTARSEVIDQEALIECLQKGTIAGAALDVIENATDVDPRLIKLAQEGKAVLVPHMGSATIESRIEMGEKVIINIQVYADGHRPPDRVLPPSFGVNS